MDILFKQDDFVFSYRVGGVLIRDGKILLQRPKGDDYSIIGGHIAAMETTEETLKREYTEELHASSGNTRKNCMLPSKSAAFWQSVKSSSRGAISRATNSACIIR